jgi:hypothetical protein
VLGLESPSYEENHPRTPVRGSPHRKPKTDSNSYSKKYPVSPLHPAAAVSPRSCIHRTRLLAAKSFDYEHEHEHEKLQQTLPESCNQKPSRPPTSRLRGFACDKHSASRLTTNPPLAPVKRGRGDGGEGATPQKNLSSYSYSVRPGGRYSYSYSKNPQLPLTFAFPFAASRLRVSQTAPKATSTDAPDARRSARAGKPELRRKPPADSRPRLASPKTKN